MPEFRLKVPEQIEKARELQQYMQSCLTTAPPKGLVTGKVPPEGAFAVSCHPAEYTVPAGAVTFLVLRNPNVVCVVLSRQLRVKFYFGDSHVVVRTDELCDANSESTSSTTNKAVLLNA